MSLESQMNAGTYSVNPEKTEIEIQPFGTSNKIVINETGITLTGYNPPSLIGTAWLTDVSLANPNTVVAGTLDDKFLGNNGSVWSWVSGTTWTDDGINIKGATGNDGAAGNDGAQGADGVDGADGSSVFNDGTGSPSIVPRDGGNAASGNYGVVGGGRYNTASSYYTTVSGGKSNTASAMYATVSGGRSNTASTQSATVSGGSSNTASAMYATVSGGSSNTASALYATVSGGRSNTASSDFANISCGRSNTASDIYATVGGGQNNTAAGQRSTVSGGRNNTASGQSATVGGGFGNFATATQATTSGGLDNTASSYYTTVSGGKSNTASAQYATVSGGLNNTASGYLSSACGSNAKATLFGSHAHSAGMFVNTGDAQYIRLLARNVTSDATVTKLFLDHNYSLMPVMTAKTTWTFSILVSAYNDTDNTAAGWKIEGVIKRDNASATTLVSTVVTSNWKDGSMSATDCVCTADNTNEALQLAVTGIADKNIRWCAVINITQVSYGTP